MKRDKKSVIKFDFFFSLMSGSIEEPGLRDRELVVGDGQRVHDHKPFGLPQSVSAKERICQRNFIPHR